MVRRPVQDMNPHRVHGGVCSTSLRSLYLRCDLSTNSKYFSPDPAIFSPKNKILILLYTVCSFMQNISIFHGKKARYDVLKIKFVEISHHRYKLRSVVIIKNRDEYARIHTLVFSNEY